MPDLSLLTKADGYSKRMKAMARAFANYCQKTKALKPGAMNIWTLAETLQRIKKYGDACNLLTTDLEEFGISGEYLQQLKNRLGFAEED